MNYESCLSPHPQINIETGTQRPVLRLEIPKKDEGKSGNGATSVQVTDQQLPSEKAILQRPNRPCDISDVTLSLLLVRHRCGIAMLFVSGARSCSGQVNRSCCLLVNYLALKLKKKTELMCMYFHMYLRCLYVVVHTHVH